MKAKNANAEKSKFTAEYYRELNPKGEPLTVEKYRELSGLQLTDEEAEQAVDCINKLARVLYHFIKNQNQ